MGVCYIVSTSVSDKLEKDVDKGVAREIIGRLRNVKDRSDQAEDALENKTYDGTQHVRQFKSLGQWRVACLYVSGIDIADVIMLCYLYNKNKNSEPNQDVLEEIDEMAQVLFEEADDWPPEEESAYLDEVETHLPDV
jgi:hypothetical protein